MISDENQCILKICSSLYLEYSQYLKSIYSQNRNVLRETEQQLLAVLAVGILNDAKRFTINAYEHYIKYVYIFWGLVEEKLPPVSFSYICWELEKSESVPCLLVQFDDSGFAINQRLSLIYIRKLNFDENINQVQIKEQISVVNQENEHLLRKWCERFYQALQQSIEEYMDFDF